MTPDDVQDLKERLRAAADNLEHMARERGMDRNHQAVLDAQRLQGKAEGVLLALDYLRGYSNDMESYPTDMEIGETRTPGDMSPADRAAAAQCMKDKYGY